MLHSSFLSPFRRRAVAFAALALWAAGCGGGDSNNNTSRGRGSASCNEWQNALCSWAQRCGVLTAAQCESDVRALACRSDEQAADCARDFSAAGCTNPPSSCDVRDVADPEPAERACNQFIDAVCAAEERCTEAPAEACADEVAAELDCSLALGVGLTFEECLSEVETLSCQATSLPAACVGVIKIDA